MTEDTSTIMVCQGPPRCMLEGDAAVEAQKAGCPWCKRLSVFNMTGEIIHTSEPAHA